MSHARTHAIASAALAGLSCFILACPIIGDSGARLRGRILIEGRPPEGECLLSLYSWSDNFLIGTAEVEAIFETTFVFAGPPSSFFITVGCRETAHTYVSQRLNLGDIDQYRAGVDLGELELVMGESESE